MSIPQLGGEGRLGCGPPERVRGAQLDDKGYPSQSSCSLYGEKEDTQSWQPLKLEAARVDLLLTLRPSAPKPLCLALCCTVVLFAPVTCHYFCVVSMVCKMLPGRAHPLVLLCYSLEESGLAGMLLQDLFVRLD